MKSYLIEISKAVKLEPHTKLKQINYFLSKCKFQLREYNLANFKKAKTCSQKMQVKYNKITQQYQYENNLTKLKEHLP